ncbi:hypothetical protein F441_09712 [Phytophthora nicotianae CJ01A1]|uniref:Uncharacterized protein n=1 Tax=Phytophthora nicotianae CJ01A1 TaxID=1317063 RepID=W2WYD7_PHYNI|nr:hypothetical protein F441_09712 [Phytophthora nicotianae CJ01A1]
MERREASSSRRPENDGAEDGVPPLRDKEDEDCLDEELLRGYLIEVGGTRNVAFLDRAVGWARCYFEVEARGIRDKLRKRARDNPEPRRPYIGTLDSVSVHAIRVSGVIDLPVTLGTLEKTLLV